MPLIGAGYGIGIWDLSISIGRMAAANFASCFRSVSLWAVQTGNPSGFNPTDICGSRLARHRDTWHEETAIKESEACVAAGKAAIEILPFGQQTEAQTRVAAGGSAATISGDSQIAGAATPSQSAPEALRAFGVFGPLVLNGSAVPKADTEIAQLIADGTCAAYRVYLLVLVLMVAAFWHLAITSVLMSGQFYSDRHFGVAR